MKIDVINGVQQVKTELDEKFFSIDDPAFIFDLLRNKIYSNPIAAVCREVACNALDAQKEIGKEEIPVSITLPTHSDLFFKVKDCGPGISPDRMENIFLKYAASTKRNTNDQIGGFGIGAKSPFSYSDSFTIVTNVDGICYNYAAFIDESRIGKLILLNETPTSEPNGTEIIVPVKSTYDITAFVTATEAATRHWKVKPNCLSGAIDYTVINPIIETDKWFIAAKNNYSYYSRNINVLVGEIEYALDVNAISQFANIKVMNAFTGDLYLKFNVGEVGLAANRETIYLDSPTKEAIKNRLELVKEEYINIIHNKLANCSSLLEANYFVSSDLGSICQNTSLLGELKWNNYDTKVEIGNDDNIHTICFSRKKRNDLLKIHKTYCPALRFQRKTKIIINDCGDVEITTRHVKKFFEENIEIHSLYIVSAGKDIDLDTMLEKNNLDQMDLEYLSKHNTNIKSRKANSSLTKTLIFELNGDMFGLTSIANKKEDKRNKVLVYLSKDTWSNSRIPYRKDKTTNISTRVLHSIIKMDPNIAIYGIDRDTSEAKVNTIFSDAIIIDEYLDTIIQEKDKDQMMEVIWANNHNDCKYSWVFKVLKKSISKITDQECVLVRAAKAYNEIISIIINKQKYYDMLSGLGLIDAISEQDMNDYIAKNNKVPPQNLYEQMMAEYPLLSVISQYYIEQFEGPIIDYINMSNNKKK